MDVHRQINEGGVGEVPAARPQSPVTSTSGKALYKVLAVLLVLVSIAVLAWLGNKALSAATADSGVKAKEYQAVFLTNGQVYFGKVTHTDSSYVKLTDIFYLQVQQTVQPKDASAAASQQQVSLAKLGGELHGPEDVMFISRQQVLFWENLKDDGKVTAAIKDYKSGKK